MSNKFVNLISQPHLQYGPLSSLILMLEDIHLVKLMRCSSWLYRNEYPMITLKKYYFHTFLINFNAINDFTNIIPKAPNAIWGYGSKRVLYSFKNVKNIKVNNNLSEFIEISKESKFIDICLIWNGIKYLDHIMWQLPETLTSFDLGYNLIKDLAPLSNYLISSNQSLKILKLNYNYIESLYSLSHALSFINNKLTYLNLNNNKIEKLDDLALGIKNNKSLVIISLNYNKIENVDPLAQTFENLNSLTSIYLSNNRIKNIDLINKSLQYNSTIKVIELKDNQIPLKTYNSVISL